MLPIVLLLLVLIIAGAIARQGLLSAFLHMICVISAGAIAFALWEPISIGFLDSVGGFSAYFAGITLVLIFLIALVSLRLLMDVLVPDNLNFNSTVDWIGASLFALIGSFVSVGVVTIGVGLLQFVPSGFGYSGWSRASGSGRPDQLSSTPMFTAVGTARFYEFLSVGSLSPMINGGALAQYRPNIDQASWSLARDSYQGGDGNARIWLQPKSISIPSKGFIYAKSFSSTSLNPSFPIFNGAYMVTVEVDVTAFDNGNQFTLSGSQARLIGPPATSSGHARTEFPMLFAQPTAFGPGVFAFDDPSNFVTSRPGQQKLAFQLFFPSKELGPPLNANYFLEIRGLRIKLPKVETEGSMMSAAMGTATKLPTGEGKPLPANDIEVTNELSVKLSYNSRGGLSINDNNKVTGGSGEFSSNRPAASVNRGLRVEEFFEPEGTRIVQLTARRGGVIDCEKYKRAGRGGEALALVDTAGQTFYPAGYIKKGLQMTEISFDPASLIDKIDLLPALPSAGNTTLAILFRVPVGATIREVRVGDTPIASLNLKIDPPK